MSVRAGSMVVRPWSGLRASYRVSGLHAHAQLEAALARARLLGQDGGYVHIREKEARAESRSVPGTAPLAGFPLAVKDVMKVAGLPLRAASRARAGSPPEARDAAVVAKLRRSGAVLVGTTAGHELPIGLKGCEGTSADLRGPGRTAGDSSAGSAMAVAGGAARLALSTDTLGTCRVSAALCGVVGFKPAWRSYPAAGVLLLSPTLDHVGLLAASVADIARGHAELRSAPGERHSPPTVGVAREQLDGAEPAVAAAVRRSLRALERAGCVVRELELPGADEVFEVSTTIMCAEAAVTQGERLQTGRAAFGLEAERLRADSGDYLRALGRRASLQSRLRRALAGIDVVAGPTVLITALRPEHGRRFGVANRLAATTRLANLVGLPAISLPLPAPLPVGLQLIGEQDEALLASAAWIERHVRQ